MVKMVLSQYKDLQLLTAVLEPNQQVSYELGVDRYGWLQVKRGQVLLNGQKLEAGDGVAIAEEPNIVIETTANAEFLLFDMA
jgi:quercetin 2,3-dioxygenase